MDLKPVWLGTDIALFALAACLALYALHVSRQPASRANWTKVLRDPAALSAGLLLLLFVAIALLDSVHFRRSLPAAPGAAAHAAVAYGTRTESLLDLVLARQLAMREVSWSEPLAWQGFAKDNVVHDGRVSRERPRLQHGGAHLQDPVRDWLPDVTMRLVAGALGGVAVFGLLALTAAAGLRRSHGGLAVAWRDLAAGRTDYPLRALLGTVLGVCLIAGPTLALMGHYHVFGTDRTGNDVLVQTLKSVRTAFVIGSLATVA